MQHVNHRKSDEIAGLNGKITALVECLQSIAEASAREPREPDDTDWRFRFLEAQRAAKCTLAALEISSALPDWNSLVRSSLYNADFEVPAVARRIYEAEEGDKTPWESLFDAERREYERLAIAALTVSTGFPEAYQKFAQCAHCWQPATCKKYGCRASAVPNGER